MEFPTSKRDRARSAVLKTRYGITLDTYNAMLKAQGYACAICRNSCTSGRRLSVDHDHTTKQVRGLLCHPCNVAIGLMQENVERLESASVYLMSHSGSLFS